MSEKAWAYYSSAADDEITNRENHAAYHRSETSLFQGLFGLNNVLGSGFDHKFWLTLRKLIGRQQYWAIGPACLYIL